jgi:hypothetical protein
MQREESTAYGALSRRALRVLAALDVAITRGGGEARVSYISLMNDYHVDRGSISKGLKQVVALGFVDVKPGPRLANIFRLSQRWRSIDAAAAERLSQEARGIMARRRFEKAAVIEPDSRPSEPESEPIGVAPRYTEQKPTLAALKWLERRPIGGPDLSNSPAPSDRRRCPQHTAIQGSLVSYADPEKAGDAPQGFRKARRPNTRLWKAGQAIPDRVRL